MKRIIRLTETDLKRIVRRVIREVKDPIADPCQKEIDALSALIKGKLPEGKLPSACMGADMEDECLSAIMGMVNFSNLQAVTSAVTDLYNCREENSGMMY